MAKQQLEDEVEEAARAGAKEGAVQAQRKEQVKQLTLKEKAAQKAAKVYKKAFEEIQQAPNVTQIAIGGVAGMAGGAVGFKVNQYLRAKTAEWEWVNDEGERSIGSILLADVMPPVVGLLMAVGGAFIPNGPLCAAVMGFGMGLAGGSVTSSAFGPD
jgi:hypothetical protein